MTATRPLRVLFVIGQMGGGGAERQVVELLRHLDRDQFCPRLYLANRQGELLDEVPADVTIHAFSDSYPGNRAPFPWQQLKLSRLLRARHLASILKQEEIDVIYDRTYLASWDAAAGAAFRPTPRVSCCVVDPEPEIREHSRLSVWLSKRSARGLYQRARAVVTNSEQLRLRLMEFLHLPESVVKVCPNLIDLDRIDRLANEFIPHMDSTKYQIVTAGRLHPQKGHRDLIQAIARLPGPVRDRVEVQILGTGELESTLKAEVQLQQLDRVIHFPGMIRNPIPWFKHADLFVLPSHYEGMPNALIEAMACGIPMISNDCPTGPAEILDQGRLGTLLPVGDIEAWMRAIEHQVTRPKLTIEEVESRRNRIRELFAPEVVMPVFESILKSAAASPSL